MSQGYGPAEIEWEVWEDAPGERAWLQDPKSLKELWQSLTALERPAFCAWAETLPDRCPEKQEVAAWLDDCAPLDGRVGGVYTAYVWTTAGAVTTQSNSWADVTGERYPLATDLSPPSGSAHRFGVVGRRSAGGGTCQWRLITDAGAFPATVVWETNVTSSGSFEWVGSPGAPNDPDPANAGPPTVGRLQVRASNAATTCQSLTAAWEVSW